jgi:hypothetical protein
MPALSQSLTFTVNSTSTVSLNYPNTGTTVLTYIGNRVKGEGYYNGSGGFHTIQLQTTQFIGKFEMQASLASEPVSADWFTVELGSQNNQSVDTSGLLNEVNITSIQFQSATTTIKTYNFIGNFIWVRPKISEFTAGTVNGIRYNH